MHTNEDICNGLIFCNKCGEPIYSKKRKPCLKCGATERHYKDTVISFYTGKGEVK